MNKLQRKNGPRSSYRQQFLVRGSFLIVDEEDDQPEPNTYWVDQNALTASTTAAAVLVAVAKYTVVAKRHAHVIASLVPK